MTCAAGRAASMPGPAQEPRYDRLLGPFHSAAGAMRILELAGEDELDQLRAQGGILALRAGDGPWAYPAFQFDTESGCVLPGLLPVLAALRPAPRWGAALWLVTEHPDLGGLSPLDALAVGAAGDDVAGLAGQYAQGISA